jgi:hypothetical protein
MTILLQWLVEHAWVFYALCIVGIIPYAIRALAAQRERKLALFTLERETATAQAVRAWAMVFVFVAIGAAIFIGTTFVLPNLTADILDAPLPTSTPSSGVQPSALGNTSTPSPTLGPVEPTATGTSTQAPVSPSPEPAEPPTPEATDTPSGAISGEIRTRFGDFAELVSYSLPAAEFSTAQPLPLTIYWQGLEGTSALDYWVFTHLLAEDGHLVAQHDGAPADGSRPVTGWGTYETIVDLHPMVFADTAYTGPARISVGLYDPVVGRVLTDTGADHVVLPVVVTIVP